MFRESFAAAFFSSRSSASTSYLSAARLAAKRASS